MKGMNKIRTYDYDQQENRNHEGGNKSASLFNMQGIRGASKIVKSLSMSIPSPIRLCLFCGHSPTWICGQDTGKKPVFGSFI